VRRRPVTFADRLVPVAHRGLRGTREREGCGMRVRSDCDQIGLLEVVAET
jgi:hypothetical protein